MDLTQTARLLDVPEQSVLRWARKGALPCRNVHGQPHFRRHDIESWARRMGMKIRGGGNAQAAEPNALASSIRRGGLVTDLPGSSPAEVLEHLAARIQPIPGLAAETLTDLLLAREQLASTAVGEGLAMPHPRQPLVQQLEEPVVVVARLREPVDWKALDQRPVHLLLLVLSATLKGHLDMLRRIGMALKAPELRRALETETDLETMCRVIEEYPE